MRVRLDANEAAENAASTIVEGIFVKEIARGMRRDVVLQCARVEFLLIFCDGDSEQIAAPAFADEPAQTFKARIARAEMQIQTRGRGIVIDRCRIHLQRHDFISPVLRAHIGNVRAGTRNPEQSATTGRRSTPASSCERSPTDASSAS